MHRPRIAHVCAVLGAALISVVVIRAQGAAGAQAPPTPPKPLIPTTAGTIALNPDAHWGENVSMMGLVDAILSKTVFTVDQDKTKSTGKVVLVIAPNLNTMVEANASLSVVGEVFKFDPAEVAKRARGYVLDLPPDVAARYQGKPAVFATGVITSQYVDIGKRLPPPLTPAEQTLRAAMMEISTNNTALRGGLTTPDAAKVKAQLGALRHGFTDAETFFKSMSAADATGWAGDALKFVGTMDTASAAEKWDDVRAAATGLNGLCTSCHTARRERQDDGSYRFKK